VAQLSSTKARDYLSHCDRTMIGWFHGANNRNWGCFQAQKTGVTAWRPPKFNSNAKNRLGADAVVAPVSSLLEVGSSSNLNAEAFVADQALIDSINEDESSLWRAMTPDFSGSLLEVDQMLGKTVFSKQDLRAGAASIISLETKIKQHLTTGQYHWTTADAEMETLHSVPRSVDWRRIMADNGAIQDWTGPVRNQGHCGSCYAFSVAAMAESRIRVATKNQDKPVLSTQAMLSCSVTNQGCMGGYPFLLAKHAAEQGFVSESCLPYSRFVKTTQCSAKCQNGDAFIATEYGYIGGFYGGSSEAAMMKQLAEHGPFSVALQAPRDLFYYMDGIFKGPKGRIEQGWEETNHAVVVVGYGVDDSKSPPIKYWIVQNTWGTRWGDHGYFKIVRGIDECAIESMPVYGLFKRSPHGSAFLELSSMVGNAEEME
jgi:cathepsin C